ncbi:MAG: low-specificity L-threonine aldolase [Gammaproteobacteria bacterium]|jgi:threonine aldolase|nr:low-specificity L-threonine aldolase [Gammaproteobacteria bacterium]MCH2658694.1 low-specificity L-threonine aldolase [Dehalococcoidia bacterium]|tara:strand:- start:850 stop:1860 length:1011 start_codon:yes stop_codon:yes gene_type:complete
MTIDFRSDTVTKPSDEMRAAMVKADVGDDVYGEDPTINQLEEFSADLLGMEGALFCPSGTQSNLLALLYHCERGEEYIVGQKAHTYQYEGGGAAALGSIHPQPLTFESDGTLDLEKVAAVIKPDDFHFPPTRLLCLENTHRGQALSLDYLYAAQQFVSEKNLKLHLDGARIFNASVELNIHAKKIAKHFDSVSFCLSKGLGAPVGSILCGSKNLITHARRWRKTLGGGMRQAGIIAAAGLYALQNNIERLSEDHKNAQLLAKGLNEIEQLTIDPKSVQTNMVFVDAHKIDCQELTSFLKSNGVLIQGSGLLRLVTHLDIREKDITTAVKAFKAYFN